MKDIGVSALVEVIDSHIDPALRRSVMEPSRDPNLLDSRREVTDDPLWLTHLSIVPTGDDRRIEGRLIRLVTIAVQIIKMRIPVKRERFFEFFVERVMASPFTHTDSLPKPEILDREPDLRLSSI